MLGWMEECLRLRLSRRSEVLEGRFTLRSIFGEYFIAFLSDSFWI